MKTRIINLTAHESRAIQRGASVIVREVKPQPQLVDDRVWVWPEDGIKCKVAWAKHCDRPIDLDDSFSRHAPYQPGDLLIGREAFRAWFPTGDDGNQGDYWHVRYKCDGIEVVTNVGWDGDLEPEDCDLHVEPTWWRSAAVMPQWAARVRRIVSAVSLKRCQELTEGECEAMGYDGDCPVGHIPSYQAGKNTYHFAQANEKLWSENRFVWVTSVKEEE